MKSGKLLLMTLFLLTLCTYTETGFAQVTINQSVQQVQPKIVTPQITPVPVGWDLQGNAATNPTVHFIGTSDAQPLVFRTNGTEQMRIDADGLFWIKALMLGYGKAGAIGFYSPPYNMSLSSPSPGMLSLSRPQGATGVALDVSGDIRASGKIISKTGVAFPDGTVQNTAAKGISGAKVDPASGNLILTMTDNTTLNAGNVKTVSSGSGAGGSIVAGIVLKDGTIWKGSGFTVSHVAGSGTYILDFPNGYEYICTATLRGGCCAQINFGETYQGIRKQTVFINYVNSASKQLGNIDQDFNFVCVKP